eukprot:197004-Amorphochlora_amoeboformis.AAC.1
MSQSNTLKVNKQGKHDTRRRRLDASRSTGEKEKEKEKEDKNRPKHEDKTRLKHEDKNRAKHGHGQQQGDTLTEVQITLQRNSEIILFQPIDT